MAIMARKFIKNCRFGRYYVMHSYNFFLAHGLLFNKRPFETKLITGVEKQPDKKKSLNNNK